MGFVWNPSFPKPLSTAGRGVPRWQGAVRSSRATEMGKLHFAQSHNFPTELDSYFHGSQVLWSGGGADQGAWSQGPGEPELGR